MEETTYGFGCILDKPDVRDYKIASSAVNGVLYPDSFECSKRARVKNQGGVGSCTAHATSTILEHHYTGSDKQLSTNFIYGIHNKLFGSEGPGLSLREALSTVNKYGDPEYAYCAGNTEVSKVYGIAEDAFNNPEAMANAENYKITGYTKLSGTNDIKYALMNYGPVLGCVAWYKWNYVDEKGVLTIGSENLDAYHAIVIYGWNETGWLCQNSWGMIWGKGGYFFLPYEYKVEEAYSVIPSSMAITDDIKRPIRNRFLDCIYRILNKLLDKIQRL